MTFTRDKHFEGNQTGCGDRAADVKEIQSEEQNPDPALEMMGDFSYLATTVNNDLKIGGHTAHLRVQEENFKICICV